MGVGMGIMVVVIVIVMRMGVWGVVRSGVGKAARGGRGGKERGRGKEKENGREARGKGKERGGDQTSLRRHRLLKMARGTMTPLLLHPPFLLLFKNLRANLKLRLALLSLVQDLARQARGCQAPPRLLAVLLVAQRAVRRRRGRRRLLRPRRARYLLHLQVNYRLRRVHRRSTCWQMGMGVAVL